MSTQYVRPVSAMFAVCLLFGLALTVRPASAVLARAVYYIPHPDDETIAMGHSIHAHLDAGRNVTIVLLTDGEESRSHDKFKTEYASDLATLDANGNKLLDRFDMGHWRRQEFKRAMNRIDTGHEGQVTLLFRGRCDLDKFRTKPGECESDPSSLYFGCWGKGLGDRKVTSAAVRTCAQGYGAGCIHKTVMKGKVGGDPIVYDRKVHPDHVAACDALDSLADGAGYRCEFYKVYEYSDAVPDRQAPITRYDEGMVHALKRDAIQYGYRLVDPPAYPAIPTLAGGTTIFDNAYHDGHEYICRSTDF